MTRFEDLSDDCLIEVLDRLSPGQLFKVQRLNKRIKRLAEIKMRTNIKAITWIKDNQLFSRCHEHLGSSSRNQLLFVGKKFKNSHKIKAKILYLNLLTKCTGIKSLEFADYNLSSDFLFEVVRRCPELECFKFVDAVADEEDWSTLLDQIGHKLVHFEVHHDLDFCRPFLYKPKYFVFLRLMALIAEIQNNLLAMVAAKCGNIKRVDCLVKRSLVTTSLTEDLVAALKMFPKTCWVSLSCDYVNKGVFKDVVDELLVSDRLDWSMFGNRNTRLSKLSFSLFSFDDFNGPVVGVEFANLKQLEFDGYLFRPKSVNGLVLSRFPRLNELTFNANSRFTEANYNRLFQNMPSLKKLTINYGYCFERVDAKPAPVLPRSSIKQLKSLEIIVLNVTDDSWNVKGFVKNLEIIFLNVLNIPDNSWDVESFVKKIKRYVGWISSLKKMTIKVGRMRRVGNAKKVLKEGVERMKQKQKNVEIDLTFAQ